MKRIRASLEFKKVVTDLALTDAPVEQQQAAYEEFLNKREEEESLAALKAAE